MVFRLARHRVTLALALYMFTLEMCRTALPLLLHGAAGTAEGTRLYTAYYYGYTPLQPYAGSLAQTHGGGGGLLVSALGSAACFVALPWALGLTGLTATAAAGATAGGCALLVLGLLGLAQTAHVPALSVVRSHWHPRGEEASGLRATCSLGSRFGGILGSALVPPLIAAMGVAGGFRVLAALLVLFGAAPWATFGASTPRAMAVAAGGAITQDELAHLAATTPAAVAAAAAAAAAKAKASHGSGRAAGASGAPGAEHGFLDGLGLLARSPAALATVAVQLSENWVQVTLILYAPLLYAEAFELGPIGAGAVVAGVKAAASASPFVGLAFERWCTRVLGVERGYTMLDLRKFGSGSAVAAQAAGLVVLGLVAEARGSGRVPLVDYRVAVCAHLAVVFGGTGHTMGWKHSVQEVGGKDAGILAGICNQVANTSGILVPTVVALICGAGGAGGSRPGAWFFPFAQAVPVLACAGAAYTR